MDLLLMLLTNKIILYILLIFTTSTVSANSIVYVKDQINVPVRSDKTFEENIIQLIPTGTELLLLQSNKDGWTQVQFKETTGWISSLYLSIEPPKKNTLIKLKSELELLKKQFNDLKAQKINLQNLNVSELNVIKAKAEEAELKRKLEEQKVKEAEEKRKLEEEKAKEAEKEKDEAKKLTEEERIRLDELEAERTAQQLAFENEQYNRLLTQEVQAEQDQERLVKIESQLNTLKSAYVNNIAARVKSFWRYQGTEDGWSAEVYVVQDRDGTVVAVDVRNANVDDSSKVKAFKDSIRRAVYKASPLPIAPDSSIFSKELIFKFIVNN
jgi:SH3 domain protein